MREQAHWIKNPHYKEFKKQPKGHCRVCGKNPLPPLRRYYCSDECSWEYNRCKNEEILEWWPQFRERIFKRDDYTCLDCGYTTKPKRKSSERTWSDYRSLAAHHIVPISKGGAMWDEDNVETLCEKCHKFKHRKRSLEPTPETKQAFLDRYTEE